MMVRTSAVNRVLLAMACFVNGIVATWIAIAQLGRRDALLLSSFILLPAAVLLMRMAARAFVARATARNDGLRLVGLLRTRLVPWAGIARFERGTFLGWSVVAMVTATGSRRMLPISTQPKDWQSVDTVVKGLNEALASAARIRVP